MTSTTPWPTTEQYAMHHRCSWCHVQPGDPCVTPRGLPTKLHAGRLDAGVRHYHRDVGAAPWPEERRSGRRYDSLPFATEFTSAVVLDHGGAV